jgi:hypothetical protein
MAAPSYIATNLADGSSITVSTEDSVYTKENLYDQDLANPFKMTTGGGWIEFDLTSSQSIDGVFIGGHNFVQSGFSCSIKAGASPSPSSVIATPSWADRYMIATFSAASYRYVRIEITDAQDTGDVTEIGQVVIGDRQVLPRAIRFGRKPHILQTGVIDRTNRGKRYALENYRLEQLTYEFRFIESELATFRAWWEAVGGVLYPFVWMEDNSVDEALYMSIEDEGFLPQELPDLANEAVLDYRVVLTEESVGAEIVL